MNIKYTKEDLIKFEDNILSLYRQGLIKSPLHLSGGNEEQLIELFEEVDPQDFIFTTYRSHYHALLKGVPEEKLLKWVTDNKSIHFMDNEYSLFSSAIVGGTTSIALGVALSKKMKGESGKVWCFIGDMTATLGTFNDCLRYAWGFDLPIIFVIENNGLSTDTKTSEVWNLTDEYLDNFFQGLTASGQSKLRYYKYTRTRPHYGIGEFVIFDEKTKESGKGF
jgi:pyruvate dehydrogenase E1 component alpha subunit